MTIDDRGLIYLVDRVNGVDIIEASVFVLGPKASERRMSDRRNDVYPIGKKNPNLPFHPAVRAGDYIFVSGQVAKDANGNMMSGTIEEETPERSNPSGASSPRRARRSPTWCGSRRISRMRAISAATTRCSPSISRMRYLARTTVEARAVINTKIEMDAIAYKPKAGLTDDNRSRQWSIRRTNCQLDATATASIIPARRCPRHRRGFLRWKGAASACSRRSTWRYRKAVLFH